MRITALSEYVFDQLIRNRSRRRNTVRFAAVGIGAALVAGGVYSATVRSGDSLSAIAARTCGNAADWTGIYAQNSVAVGSNPNLIYPGQHLAFHCDATAIQTTLSSAQAPPVSANGKTRGVTYGDPNYCGDGDNDGWDVPCSTQLPQASSGGYKTVTVTQGGSYSGAGGFQSCVIAAESGGNSQVMNSTGHYGLYQFSASTWAEYGGSPSSFGNASVAQQNQVFATAMASPGGESNWAPYDGC
jgi:hypothetical protein